VRLAAIRARPPARRPLERKRSTDVRVRVEGLVGGSPLKEIRVPRRPENHDPKKLKTKGHEPMMFACDRRLARRARVPRAAHPGVAGAKTWASRLYSLSNHSTGDRRNTEPSTWGTTTRESQIALQEVTRTSGPHGPRRKGNNLESSSSSTPLSDAAVRVLRTLGSTTSPISTFRWVESRAHQHCSRTTAEVICATRRPRNDVDEPVRDHAET